MLLKYNKIKLTNLKYYLFTIEYVMYTSFDHAVILVYWCIYQYIRYTLHILDQSVLYIIKVWRKYFKSVYLIWLYFKKNFFTPLKILVISLINYMLSIVSCKEVTDWYSFSSLLVSELLNIFKNSSHQILNIRSLLNFTIFSFV